jgi:anaerobic magnesium-protoporphyrin IX monomethyl ester cyclase
MKDMKRSVVLFNPRVRVGKEQQKRTGIPLGLLAVATPLDLEGYPIRIVDQRTEPDWRAVLLEELNKSPVCFGAGVKTGPQIRYALEASRLVKAHRDVPVVWGGVHPSLLPGQTLEHDSVDIVVQGEGDVTFPELVHTLEKGEPLGAVKGIWFKENGEIHKTPPRPFVDLATLPSPSYHLIDVDKFKLRNLGLDHLRLSSSRGCPYGCAFCYNTAFYKRRWRALSAERTFEEIRRLRQEFGVRGIRFADDVFFADLKRVRRVLELILENRLDVLLTKLDIHVAELDQLGDDFLELLQKAGARALVVGVESGSQRILDLISKKIDIQQVIDFNLRVKKFNMIPKYCFMVGFPTETVEDIKATVALIFRLIEDNEDAIKDINIYTPYPGTELFDLAVKHGFEPPRRLEDWVSFNWRTVNRKRMPWISKEREKLLRMLHCSSLFLENNYFMTPIWPTNPLIVRLARMYRPLARKRVEHLFYRFPAEIRLVEWLGLYPRQL